MLFYKDLINSFSKEIYLNIFVASIDVIIKFDLIIFYLKNKQTYTNQNIFYENQ